MLTKTKIFLTLLVLVLAVVAGVGLFAEQVAAITTKILRSQVQTIRYRVTTVDVLAGAQPDNSVRDVALFTLGAGDQVLTWVSKVNTAFTITPDLLKTNDDAVYISAIRARQNGVDISSCDIAMPPDLTFVNFEHRLGNCFEYAFYDEDQPVDIVVSFQSRAGTNLNNITGGAVDFIVSKIQ